MTFNIKGYKPIVCKRKNSDVKNDVNIYSYETVLSEEERKLLNNQLVSKAVKRLRILKSEENQASVS